MTIFYSASAEIPMVESIYKSKLVQEIIKRMRSTGNSDEFYADYKNGKLNVNYSGFTIYSCAEELENGYHELGKYTTQAVLVSTHDDENGDDHFVIGPNDQVIAQFNFDLKIQEIRKSSQFLIDYGYPDVHAQILELLKDLKPKS
jgi:hypothetical protein